MPPLPSEPLDLQTLSPAGLAALIDHTLLKAEADREQIAQLCAQARVHGFWSVCVNPLWVAEASRQLKGSEVKVCTVVGFPLGAADPAAKAAETARALTQGAQEIDMVLALGLARSGEWSAVEADIRGVVKAAGGCPVKVILETCYLNEEQIVKACQASEAAGAAFVKTSTGFGSAGATEAHVTLMRASVGPGVLVKASGGLRTWAQARQMLAAGARRLGLSAGVSILAELEAERAGLRDPARGLDAGAGTSGY